MIAQVQGDEASNTGDSERTYWLTGDENPCFWVRVAFGPSGPPGGPAYLMALVDGKQVPFASPDLGPVLVIQVPAQAYSDRSLFCVDVSFVDDGRHVLNLAFEADGVNFATLGYFAHTVVLYKNSFCVPELPFADTTTRPAHPGEAAVVENSETGEFIAGYPGMVFASSQGRLPVRVALARPSGGTGDTIVFAMLDNVQIPLGELGPRPRFLLPGPGELGVFEFEFTGLPADGQRHVLTMFAIQDYSSDAEDESGNRTRPAVLTWGFSDFWVREGG